MIRVLSIFGTRPEAIKMAPVISELNKYPKQIDNKICAECFCCHEACPQKGIELKPSIGVRIAAWFGKRRTRLKCKNKS